MAGVCEAAGDIASAIRKQRVQNAGTQLASSGAPANGMARPASQKGLLI